MSVSSCLTIREESVLCKHDQGARLVGRHEARAWCVCMRRAPNNVTSITRLSCHPTTLPPRRSARPKLQIVTHIPTVLAPSNPCDNGIAHPQPGVPHSCQSSRRRPQPPDQRRVETGCCHCTSKEACWRVPRRVSRLSWHHGGNAVD